MSTTRIICGDIGGTNARLELWTAVGEAPLAVDAFTLTLQKIYPSAA
jgi:glucokinase